MKGLAKNLFTVIMALMLFCGISSIGGVAFAQDEEIPEDGVRYTLTYPDGTVVTEKDGKPLTYDDVIEALEEENWKLLLSNQESDANGKVDLPASWKAEGAIKIIETKVPAGYTQGQTSEVVTDLKENSATFINPKEKETPLVTPEDKVKITYDLNGGKYNGSTDDIVEDYVKGTTITIHDAPERSGYTFDYWKGSEYQPGDTYTANENHTFTAQWIADTPTTDKKTPGSNPKTGDNNKLGIFLLLALASAAIITAVFIRRKKRIAGVITILLVGTFAFSSVFAADGFVINKIDDSNDPVEGAVFDIYGKPDVSWEALPPETITVSGKKTWTSSTGNNDDLDPSKIPANYTVRLEKSTDGTNWTAVDTQDVSSYMATPPMSPTDPILPVDEWTFSDLPEKENGVDIQYRVVEETVPAGFTMSGGTKDANGKYNLTNTYTPTTSSVNINVGLSYRIFPEAEHWSNVVATQQKVTVSGGSMTDKVLSFTPGAAAQEVELPGAGTYTISMTGITKSDLKQEETLSDTLGEYMPILIDTVSVTVTVDESGNCTVSGSPAYETFTFGVDQNGTFIYNDIDALNREYYVPDDGLNKRGPHSDEAGAAASGNTVTLTTVISQVWNPSTGIEVI